MTFTRRMLLMLTGLYWVVLFVFTHLPPARVPRAPGGDKLHHFLAYLVLAFMLGATLWQLLPGRRRVIPLVVFLAAAGYGIVDELTQIAVGRDAEVADWVADVCGGAAGALALLALRRLLPPRPSDRSDAAPLAIEPQ